MRSYVHFREKMVARFSVLVESDLLCLLDPKNSKKAIKISLNPFAVLFFLTVT